MLIRHLLVASVCWIAAQACLSSGVCGGCNTPPASSCVQSSCQPGYSCGQYGCARNRVRGTKTRRVSGIILDEDPVVVPLVQKRPPTPSFNIYGFRRSQLAPPPVLQERLNADNISILRLTNPNYIFRECCEERGLPDACLHKCHFNTYTKDALQAMYFKQDGCPLEAAADIQFCAAQGRDHRDCCSRNGVTTTLAGNKCLTFCDQRPDHITKLDYSYVPCYDRFENMKRCFYNEIKVTAERKYGLIP